MLYGADTTKGDGEDIVQLDSRAVRDLEPTGVDDGRVSRQKSNRRLIPILDGA